MGPIASEGQPQLDHQLMAVFRQKAPEQRQQQAGDEKSQGE